MAALNLNFNPTIPIAAVCSSPSSSTGGRKPMMTPGLWQARREKGKGPVAVGLMAKASTSGGGKYKGTQMREKQLSEMIEKKVMEAKEVCGEDESSDECKVAWDEVEEVSQAKADLRLKLEIMHQDPLESFCQENPETDECRLYED